MAGFFHLAGDFIGFLTRKNRRVCIINYHRVLEHADPLLDSDPDVATFRWHMKLLAKSFNVLPLGAAVDALKAGTLPARAVCITFDDGYKSTFELALPILKEFGLTATVFVTSGTLMTGNMWNDRIIEAIRNFRGIVIDLSDLDLGHQAIDTLPQRLSLINTIVANSKYMTLDEREAIVAKLEALSGPADVVVPEQLQEENDHHGLMMTPEMVATLVREGIEIGGHTISHPILMKVGDDEARSEIKGNKQHLEEIIGAPVQFFAYPNGKRGIDFDERHMRMARDAGFTAAFTTAIGAASAHSDPFAFPRSRPWDKTSLMYSARLLQWLSGM